MPQPAEEIAAELRTLTEPGARSRLVAKGLARGMIWRNGRLPPETPAFARGLSADLLDHGYLLLSKALQLREQRTDPELAAEGFRVAAESIESVVRRGDPRAPDRGFHIVVAAASFHLARLAARSYCLVPEDTSALHLSTPERVLVRLMRRDLAGLRDLLRQWLNDERNTDEAITERLGAAARAATQNGSAPEEEDSTEFGPDDALVIAITRRTLQGVARFEYALHAGSTDEYRAAIDAVSSAAETAAEARFVSLWWTATLARHLIEELWNFSLHERLPRSRGPQDEGFDELRSRFIRVLSSRSVAEVDLWPSQIEAARRAIDPADDLVVALPTSAGKTRIAELCILRALAAGKRAVYVTPLRALSAQVERGLARTFRPLGFTVSSLYGASGVTMDDVRTLRSADVVVATPEKLDFSIRQEPELLDDIGLVVLDEGHMIGESTREIRYEVLVQRLLSRGDADMRRVVCLSAVFSAGGSFTDFTQWLRSDEPGDPVQSKWRPTRQRSGVLEWIGTSGRLSLDVDGESPFVPHFVRAQPGLGRRKREYPEGAAELTVAAAQALVGEGHRVLVYCPQRGSVESLGKLCLTLNRQGHLPALIRDTRPLTRAFRLAEEWLGFDHVATQALFIGIGIHHGGLPRPFLAEVERLLNAKALPVVIASPTVAQGLDLSCSALVLRSIYRGGEPIEPKEYANVVGRAGRAFVDLDGLTIYPIYEKTRRASQFRLKDYERLRGMSRSRELESGILLLIRSIIEVMAARLGGSVQAMLEYVTNVGGPWEQAGTDAGVRPPVGSGDPGILDDELESLLADLDTTVFSTVEDLECAAEDLPGILDAALQSSLWRRRLEHAPPAERLRQREVLVARARWLWANSTPVDRKSCFSSGIGHSAGRYIKQHLDVLLTSAVRAETLLAAGDVEEAIAAMSQLAGMLLHVHPFDADLPDGWGSVLGGWVRGVPVGEMVGTIDGEEVSLIHDAFVYRLVWAVESVRVHGLTIDDPRARQLSGLLPLVLTYGLPSVQGGLLAQAGLASRTMTVRVLEEYPGVFTEPREISGWLRDVVDRMPDSFWVDAPSRELWSAFLGSWRSATDGRWGEDQTQRSVVWDDTANHPPDGAPVQLIDDGEGDQTLVYTPDLARLGVLGERMADLAGAYIEASVDGPATIVVKRYGLRAAA